MDRLNRMLDQVEKGNVWIGDTPNRDSVSTHLEALKSAINQLEAAIMASAEEERRKQIDVRGDKAVQDMLDKHSGHKR